MHIARLIFLASFFFLFSCEKWLIDMSAQHAPSNARLLLYLHSTSVIPTDISFTVSEIKIQAEDGSWLKLADGPIDIKSGALVDRQILLKDAVVEPGVYKAIKIILQKASIKGRDGDASLALPQPGGEVVIKSDIRLQRKESSVVSLAWDTEKSVAKGYMFQPDSIEAELQKPSAMGLLLFISNSASNYITIIDRSLERVVGAVTVGDRPMGMALNYTQDRLYVVNSGSRNISIIDTTQFSVLDTILLTSGLEPTDIVIISDERNLFEGKLYITNRLSNDVTVVSTVTKRVLKTISVGMRPSAIAVDTIRKEIYVANEQSNSVSIINAINDTFVVNITVDSRPAGFIAAKDKLYVFNEGSHKISIISLSLRKVISTISVEGPPKRGIRGFNDRLFVVNTAANTIIFLNSFDVVTRTIPAGVGPIGLAGDEKRNRLYISNYGGNTVSLIDIIGEKMLKEFFVGKSPYGVLLLER